MTMAGIVAGTSTTERMTTTDASLCSTQSYTLCCAGTA
jgi:hypothetical protein